MAKVSFAKLGLKVNNDVKTFEWLSGDEVTTVEVKQYLPIEEKLAVISNIINNSIDDNDFYNPVRLEIFTTLEILYAYTNFNITPKMKEDPFKLYDVVLSSGLFDKILEAMPTEEFDRIDVSAHATIRNIYNYKNSAAGILHLISADYNNLNLDLINFNDKITDPNSLAVLKEIAPMLGLNV
jgi:hypothetical protein